MRESQRRVRQPENPTTPTGSDHGVDSEARSKKNASMCTENLLDLSNRSSVPFDLMVHSSQSVGYNLYMRNLKPQLLQLGK